MRRFRILSTLLLLAACNSGDGTGPAKVAKIVVTPGQATLSAVGATQQFQAQPQDAGGGNISGVVVTWRSSNAAIVKVDATGLATAVAEGTAAVVAEASGASGQADVFVDVPDCTSPRTVSLQPGQMFVTDPPANASCALTLPSGAVGSRYRVAIVRLGSAQDATQVPSATLRLTARGVVATPPPAGVQEASLPPLFTGAQMATLERSHQIAEATERVHERLRAAEDELIRRIPPYRRVAPIALATDGPLPVSPLKRTFLPRLPTDTQCSPAKPAVTGLLVAQNGDVAVYQDSAQAQTALAVTMVQAQMMFDFFSRYGKTTIESYFGAIPDRDGNGQIVVFATPDVADPIAAFVWGGDQLAKTGPSPCPASNEAELVYFNAQLIRGLTSSMPNYQAIETLVHEVKHVVSFNQRVTGVVFNTQPTWVEEGTAEIAGEAASRRGWAATGGPAQNGVVVRQSFTGSFTPENYGIALRLTRTRSYLNAQPNAVVVATSAAYSVYGSSWHFHRFLGDGYGGAASSPGGDASLFRTQNAASTPPGLAGFPVITGKSYEALLPEYAAAIMLNGTGTPAPTRAFTTYDFPSAITAFAGGPPAPYPYPVTAVGSNPSASFASGTWTGQIGNGGIRVHDFVSNGTGTGTEITVQVEPPARVVVVRLR